MKESNSSGVLFVLGAALLWGTTGTAQAFAPAGFDSSVLGALRLAIGGVILMCLALARRELGPLKGWPLKGALMAALFTACYQLCFFAAVARTGVAVGTIVGIGSAPVAAGLLAFLFRGEKPGWRWMLATLLAVGGCILLGVSGGKIAVDPLGLLLALGAGGSYAAYTLAIKGMLDHRPPTAVMAVVVCLGALILSPMMLGKDLSWLAQERSILVVLHLGIFTMALSYWLFARGLKSVSVANAVTLSLAEPMMAALLGLLVLGEILTTTAGFGVGLIFAGLLVLCLRRPRPATPAEEELPE